MGRHSIPDPDESAGEEQPEEPQTERFGYVGDDEPDDGPGTASRNTAVPAYGHTEYPDLGYRETPIPRRTRVRRHLITTSRNTASPTPPNATIQSQTSPCGIGSATANATPLRAAARR